MTLVKKVTKRQWLIMAYLPIHFIWYFILEAINVTEYTVVYSRLDDFIPFCEWFIFPYIIWFLFMAIPGVYFLFKDPEAYEKYLLSLFIGFFTCSLIMLFFPTGQELRPEIDPSGNIALWGVNFIYAFDTNTNVFPSMHVVGAMAVMFAMAKSKSLGKKVWLQIFSWILGITIICATVFLKQHSVLDIFGALAIEIPIMIFVYKGIPSRWLDKLIK